ncbi:MAG: hypothetical protein GC161_18290 [Planctomycetaceae bacterium]|nr:hypothetical protein [Planctomycetaceae bacterium]
MKRAQPIRRKTRMARLGRRGKRVQKAVQIFRAVVLARAKSRCQRCSKKVPPALLEAHHLLPRARGGDHNPDNGAALCRECRRQIHSGAPDAAAWLRTTTAVNE